MSPASIASNKTRPTTAKQSFTCNSISNLHILIHFDHLNHFENNASSLAFNHFEHHLHHNRTKQHKFSMSSSSSAFKKFTAAAKAHHQSVNAAYDTYYSGGVSPRMSSTSERPSAAASRQNSTSSVSSNLHKAWKKIKEHHDSMNDAYVAYYGGGRPRETWTSPRHSVEEAERAPLVEEKEGLGKKMKNMAHRR